MGRRYARPDDFDRLLTPDRKTKRKLNNAIRPHKEIVHAMYIKIDPDRDLQHAESYTVKVVIVLVSARCNAEVEGLITKFAIKLSGFLEVFCDEAPEIEVKYDYEFTIQEADEYEYWDYDFYSVEVGE